LKSKDKVDRQPLISLIGVIDDDEFMREALSRLLRSAGYKCAAFSSSQEFLDSGPAETDCLLLDIQMPGLNGLDLQAKLREIDRAIPVIFVTAKADNEARARALQQGAAAFFTKPFNDDALLGAIQSAMQNRLG
jgi:FixJ family two-component response regulator